jgi:hypothetical protein
MGGVGGMSVSLPQATRSVGLAVGLALTAVLGVAAPATADPPQGLSAVPFEFVGTAAQCGGTPGSNIVTAGWLRGMGLPDDGTSLNTAPSARKDRHTGLLLNKNGPTTDCSSAGAEIKGFKSGSTLTELGFDYRNGTHCGAGAPRFNITSTAGVTYFAGCFAGTKTPAPQDPAQWTRVRITTTAQVFGAPPFVFAPAPGATQVRSLSILFDEGTDATSADDPNGVGLVVLDNIDVNGRLITKGTNARRMDD